MVRLIDLDVKVVVGDNDKLVEDNGVLGIVSSQEDFVFLTMGKADGIKSYLITKKFAKELSQALSEYADE